MAFASICAASASSKLAGLFLTAGSCTTVVDWVAFASICAASASSKFAGLALGVGAGSCTTAAGSAGLFLSLPKPKNLKTI
jgi:hypothetical protein